MATLAPFIKHKFTDSDGNPLSGGLLYTYASGTSTPLATYTDAGGGTANANPVVLDANGECNLWLSTSAYKFVLKNSALTTQWTVDAVSLWGDAPSAIYRWAGTAGGSANVLTLTPAITITAYATGQRFAFIPSIANTGSTTVNVSSLGAKTIKTLSGSNLVGGEMIVGGIYDITYDGTNFFLNETVPDSSVTRAKLAAGSMSGDVKSKTTTYTLTASDDVVLGSSSGAAFTMTLPTAVGISGKMFILKKTDTSANAITIDTTSSQTIDGVTSVKLAARYDFLRLVSDGANWMIADSKTTSEVFLYAGNGNGSTNTAIRRMTNNATVGSAITYADSATLGATLTINEAGNYRIDYTDQQAAGGVSLGITKNSAQLTTAIESVTITDLLASTLSPAAGYPGECGCTARLIAGDVIRMHTQTGASAPDTTSNYRSRFRITKV